MQRFDAVSRGDRNTRSASSPLGVVRRTFARLTAFDLACPNCGTVDCVSAVRPWWRRKTNFDPWRSRWRCRSCRRVFAVGIALWPVSTAGNRPREGRPVDTIPTKHELLGLQQTAQRGWCDPVNLTRDCVGTDSSGCPLHGPDGL